MGGGIGRRDALVLAAAAMSAALGLPPAEAEQTVGATVLAPVQSLNDALIAAMKSGEAAPFNRRYAALDPVIGRVFDLHAVLAASIGLSWSSIPDAQKATLADAFRRYTVSSYVANFDSYDGQSFDILPGTRVVSDGETVVRTRLNRPGKDAVKLDYVLRSGADGWRIVDVLTDGTISRVAVQRSDFRELLANGGVAALTGGLERKVSSLSGSMQG